MALLYASSTTLYSYFNCSISLSISAVSLSLVSSVSSDARLNKFVKARFPVTPLNEWHNANTSKKEIQSLVILAKQKYQ